MRGARRQEDGYLCHHFFCCITLEIWWAVSSPPSLIMLFPPHKPDLNSSSVESCLNCIQLIILLLRIFPVSGRVIHLYPSQLTPAWWHMTASAWVSTDWLISPLALPLWDNGNEWQHVQRFSKALHATLAATSGGLARSTAPLPLRAHVQQDAFWQLHQNLHDILALFFYLALFWWIRFVKGSAMNQPDGV